MSHRKHSSIERSMCANESLNTSIKKESIKINSGDTRRTMTISVMYLFSARVIIYRDSCSATDSNIIQMHG